MSTCIVLAFVAVRGGIRLESKTASGHAVHHAHYNTALKTNEGQFLGAKLRVYCGPSQTPFADNTVAFIVAKVHAASGAKAVVDLDAIQFFPVPGDPAADGYDDNIPDIPAFIHGVGHVPSIQPQGIALKSFTLAMAEYVGTGMKQFSVHCFYPAGPRWQNTPLPRALSCTQFTGICNGRDENGLLRVEVDHITLNLGPHMLAAAPGSTSPAVTPTKRKYQAATDDNDQPAASTSKAAQSATPSNKRKKFVPPSPAPVVEEGDEDEDEEEPEEDLGKGNRDGSVRFGSSSGRFSANSNLNFWFGSALTSNLEPELRFRFGTVRFAFGTRSNSEREITN